MTWIGTPAESQRGQRFYESFNPTPSHTIITAGDVTFSQGYATVGPTVNDYATIPVGSDVVPPSPEAGTYIVRLRNLQPSASNSALVSFGDATGNSPIYFGTQGGNVGGGAGALFTANSGASPVAGATYHLALTYSGTSYEMFIDGVSVGSGAAGFDLGDNPRIWLGGLGGTANFCGGDILSIRVFRGVVLTDQEILDFYNRTTYSYLSEAVGSWPMLAATHDPGNSRTLDVSGNANHASFSPTPPTKIATRHGYEFNGTNNYFNVSQVGLQIGASDFTVFSAFRDLAGSGDRTLFGTLWFDPSIGIVDLRVNSSNLGEFTTLAQGAGEASTGTSAIDGSFHTLAGVIGEGRNRVYSDGRLEGDSAHVPGSYNPNVAYTIGSRLPTAQWFPGEILSVFFVRRCLTPIQIKNLHLGAVSTYNQE